MSAKKGHVVEKAELGAGAQAIIAKIKEGDQIVNLDEDVRDSDLEAIKDAVKRSPFLRHLIFCDIVIWEVPGFGEAMADAMRMHRTLRSLVIAANHLSDAGAIAIAEALKTNQNLKNLSLAGNAITDEGASAFAAALKVNRTLEILDLLGNQITDAGATALAKSLIGNTTLKGLCIGRNEGITDESVPALKEMLQTSHLTPVELRVTPFGEDGDEFGHTSISAESLEELNALLGIPIENRAIPSSTANFTGVEEETKKYLAFFTRRPNDNTVNDVAMRIKNVLSDDGEVFMDGGRHQSLDIAHLFRQIEVSKTVVLFLLKEQTIEMPVCLLELNHALMNAIPIVIVTDEEVNSMDEIIEYVSHLETGMKEAGVELMKWCNVDVDDVSRNVSRMISDAHRNDTIKRINMKNGLLLGEMEEILKSIREPEEYEEVFDLAGGGSELSFSS